MAVTNKKNIPKKVFLHFFDLIGLLPQRWRFDHVFRKFENKILLNYLA